MDPAIWGPSVWNIMIDVASRIDRSNQLNNETEWAVIFYQCLCCLIPCIHCQNSYVTFLIELPVVEYIEKRQTLLWVWKIKEKVNDKLNKPESYRLLFELLERRVNCLSNQTSDSQVFDILFLFCINIQTHDKERWKCFRDFIISLSVISPFMGINKLIIKNSPPKTEQQNEFITYLYTIRKLYHDINSFLLPPLVPLKQLITRYLNCRTDTKEITRINYMIIDSSTWETKLLPIVSNNKDKKN